MTYTKRVYDLGKQAICKWGNKTQISKLKEELLELTLALEQLDCPTKDYETQLRQVESEFADVIIMLSQAQMIFDFEKVAKLVDIKCDKLEKHLNS
jgi:NTP pyrophosphatase (non-canonical NTP hydrolase)